MSGAELLFETAQVALEQFAVDLDFALLGESNVRGVGAEIIATVDDDPLLAVLLISGNLGCQWFGQDEASRNSLAIGHDDFVGVSAVVVCYEKKGEPTRHVDLVRFWGLDPVKRIIDEA